MTAPQQPGGFSRRAFVRAGLITSGGAALAACSSDPEPLAPTATTVPVTTSPTPTGSGATTSASDSWAPAPVPVGDLSVLATQQGESLLLHTKQGRRGFWTGVTLGTAMPARLPEQMEVTAAEYRRWLPMMGDLGIRVIRLTTIHPPHFYAELLRYNTAHPHAPLYLVQGVSMADVPTGDLYARETTAAMSAEIRDASAAVHGSLTRPASRGRTTGRWSADVSPWVAAWIVGRPLEPAAVSSTDRARRRPPQRQSRYFAGAAQATPTEAWLAARMDELATLEADHGLSVPIAAENWPTTDPLTHPEEPLDREDLVGVDVNRIVASTAWPAGTFVAYAAPPYGPDFLFHQPSYTADGDPYRAYLLDLKRHHSGRPLLVTDVGVPSSLGAARQGPRDRHLGNHSEQAAMQHGADIMRMYSSIGLAGGVFASWTDDWTASSWNTAPRHEPAPDASAPLWHDPLTAAQWFGLIAHDPVRIGERTVYESESEMQRIDVDHDASYLYLTFYFSRRVTSPVDIGFDLVPGYGLRLPGGGGDNVFDVSLQVIPTMSTATCYIRTAIDPVRLDGLPTAFLPRAGSRGWGEQRLTLARPMQVPSTERDLPARMQEIGSLRLGTWDPKNPAYDSRATWSLDRPDSDKPARLSFRLPWSMLAIADPTTKLALIPRGGEPTGVPVQQVSGLIESSTPGSPTEFTFDWEPWTTLKYTERIKAGVDVLAAALAETSGVGTQPPATATPSTPPTS